MAGSRRSAEGGRKRVARGRPILALVTAAILAVGLTVTPGRAMPEASAAATTTGSLPATCLDPDSPPQTPELQWADAEFVVTNIAMAVESMVLSAIALEKEKPDKVKEAVRRVAYCFPGYNVVIAQPHDGSTQHMKEGYYVTTIELSETTYRVYVFKSGTFYQAGDLGYKNWGYQGFFTKSSDDRTVTFSTPPVPARRSGWSSDAQGCEVTTRDLPDRSMYQGLLDMQNSDNQGKHVRALLDDMRSCFPDYNVMVMHDEQPYEWVSAPTGGVHAKSYSMQDTIADGESTEVATWGSGVKGRGHYDVYVFKKGTFHNKGDGGWINWAFYGNFTRSADGMTVTFDDPGTADLNYDPMAGSADDDFGSNTAQYTSTANGPYPGCGYTGSVPGDRAQLVQSLTAEYQKCFPNTNILVVKSVDQFSFGVLSNFKHLSTVNDMNVFALDSGVVRNNGDGGWINWGFSGTYDRSSESTVHFTHPAAPPVPPTNPYPSDAKTFTVNGGSTGTSFYATQPQNSVATYTWTDGQAPQEWLTSANGGALDRKMQPVAVTNWGGSTDTISVDPGRTYQTIDGFGGAMTDSAASLILGSPDRDTILSTLFGTGDGRAGLTMVRSPMGSSDLMADGNDFHTYEDTRGSFSAESTASDQRQIDALQRAKATAGGDLKILGTPWSAPGWAKRSGSLKASECGNDLNELNVGSVSDYAGYFKKYVDAYAAKGIKPWMVSMQNEPENCKTAMPTTLLSPTDEVALAKALKQQLPSDVKVMGWDHNWNDKDFVNTLTSQAAGSVDAIGYHCYDGTHYANQTQALPTYMTECSGFTDSTANVAQNLGWEVGNLLIGPLRYGSRGSIYWTLAQDQNGGPHLAGGDACATCRGMITMHNDGHFEPSQDFYYYAQFSKFIRPGAVRIESNNSGDISTVAFRDGNRTTLVVLISGTHADGGSAGSDERDLRGHILQYSGEVKDQKTSWLVGADGYRRWIGDSSTYNCLKYDAGMQGPDNLPGGALDKYINIKDVWAVCGAVTMGTRSELEVGTYLKTAGGARLTLTKDGLRSVDSTGKAHWAPPGTGDRLILQEDQNLVLYSGTQAVWESGTKNSGAIWLSLRDDGTFALFNKDNQKVWVSPVDASSYKHMMVQWDGDSAAQKTSWMVGNDGNRRWVPDAATFQCLHDAGSGNSVSVSSDVLDKLPDLTNVWATCGADRIGANGAIEEASYLKAGDYRLTLTSGDLVLAKNGATVWSTGHGGAQLKLQTDGNLVEYDNDGHATWATGTNGKSAGWLVLGADGSLRLYDADGKQVWTR